jgi:N4-gp56 family major capsid protein
MKFYEINAQLFANELQTTLLPGLSAEMKTFYDMTLIDEAQANLVHDQFGQKRPIPANGGKTIEFRKFAPLAKATTPLTEGVTPDGKSLAVSTITATVNQYGDYITQSDVLELTSLDNTILEATKLLGRQAGVTLDTIVRDVLNSSTNVTYCPKVATGGAETAVTSRANLDATSQLTVKVIQQVVAKLRGQNAPTIGGKYVAIIHPYVAYDLMRDPEWIDAHKYANPTNLYEGEIGEIAGVRFVQTTEAKVFDGGVFSTLFLGEGAYGVTEITGGGLETLVKQKGSAGTADPLDQRSSVGWKAMKTAEILIPNYLVRVESKSATFSATTNAN